uniref:TonB-dependent receptor n=1 Tax=Fulvivirga sp. TaxID=1931237 RepID=UPI004049A352
MNKIFTKVAIASLFVFCGLVPEAFGQTTISGKVLDAGTEEPLAGVNIIVKGKVIGTITDFNGEYNLSVNDAPPFTLVFSFIGYSTQEIEITNASTTGLNVTLEEQSLLGQEIVVSASRVEESILESPVSIEKMDILAVQNTAADNYYKGIANMKGVDVATSSINFQIINARGFASTGNTRFVQLTDGMDTQAPALNFPIGNLNGPSELDVESVELIPGAASALYGPNAFNGILLVNSKSAFDYQGASAFAKVGVNHIGSDADQDMAPMYEASIRYAKAFNNKFAFKLNASYMRADDWHGTSDFDRNASLTPTGYDFNPGADKLHFMGDEASTNIGFLGFAAQNAFAAQGTPNDNATFAGLRALFNGTNTQNYPAGFNASNYLGDIPSQTVSRTPYMEESLINYGAENFKTNVGLYYRLSDELELSYLLNYGFGTSIYTGAQRYSLVDFSITQHRLQLRGDNFFLRGYTTIENSGDSYITEFLGNIVNESYSGNSTWFATYTANYLSYLGGRTDLNLPGAGYSGAGLSPGELGSLPTDQRLAIEQQAHLYARMRADINRFDSNSAQFGTEKESGLASGTIPNGPSFADKSKMYHVEGQYDFKNQIDFMGLQVGASYRTFDLRSNGTIFPDQDGGIQIKEYGAYMQASKKLLADKVKLTGSLRYDKNENFDGQLNPRISAVWTVAENNNIRASVQTGFRNPTTQGQYIDLDIISARLLGGLPESTSRYNLTTNGYTGESVAAYSNAIFSQGSSQAAILADGEGSARSLLVPVTELEPVKPEQVQSFEIGYKSVVANKLLIDAAYYYNNYTDFITQVRVRTASAAIDNPTDPQAEYSARASLLSGNSNNTFQYYTNISDQDVSSQGAVLGLTYSLPRGYNLEGNYTWSKLNNELEGVLTEFNTPEHKVNFSIGNRKLTDKLGFKLTYRWQEAFVWESSFAQGPVPSYSTLDGQISYRLPDLKSVLKLGGSNLLNQRYIQSLGGPNIGAIYYLSITFDELMR